MFAVYQNPRLLKGLLWAKDLSVTFLRIWDNMGISL
jgi:hypothetical protein